MKPIPKSLHTLTVLVAIAHDQRVITMHRWTYEDCVDAALSILGLYNAPDVYGLREQAIRKLSKGV